MQDLQLPRGMHDLLPNEALFKQNIVKKIEENFKKFGFLAINTPSLETLDILKAKNVIGEEDKLIFEIKDENLGLRYDQTVSLARYYSMHREVQLPFKRYAIGNVWRKEEPQKNRYREFTQADVDILGGNLLWANAEIIATLAKSLEEIEINYSIKINDRKFLDLIFEKLGINAESHKIFRIIDKLDKLGKDEIARQLNEILEENQADEIIKLIGRNGTNNEKLDFLSNIFGENEDIKNMRNLINLLNIYELKGSYDIDFSLVRGLDYYTSLVFEFKNPKNESDPSIGGGGRYDNLIEKYSPVKITAVGGSIGIDRIINMLNPEEKYTPAKVILCYINENNFEYALKIANQLRNKGIYTDLNISNKNIVNQLKYANALKFEYAVIVGDEEEKERKAKLRELLTGKEEKLSVDDIIQRLLS
ncbi:MAG: histidine--tRNA ligase [Candidatus Micrarchaeaceae archaeon]